MGSPLVLNGIGNGSRRSPALLVALAITAYAFGIASSPLLGFFKCKDGHLEPQHDALRATHSVVQPLPPHELPFPDWSVTDLVRFQSQCNVPLPSEAVQSMLLDKLFNGVSPFKGFPPEHVKPLLREQRIKGWGSYGSVFERLMKEVNPRVVVELGSFLGASATHMGTLAKELGLQTLILCVDDFRGWPGFRDKLRSIKILNGDVMLLYQFMQNVVYMNLTDSVFPVPFSTSSVLSKLCEWGIYADLVEVDAAHDFHSAWADINAANAILRPGGVMFGHDYYTKVDNRGVGRAVDLFAKTKGLRVEPDGQHWIMRSK